jgi:hypothetical protein
MLIDICYLIGHLKQGQAAMSAEKWAYEEVTASAKTLITTLLANAEGLPAEQARMSQEWAYGVYLGWHYLTLEQQKEGDAGRMAALANNASNGKGM